MHTPSSMFVLRIFGWFVATVFVATSASAYGPIGHQIVGAIADERLANTPAAAKIRTLLQGYTLEKAAVIPDEIKGWDKNGVDDPKTFRYSSRPRLDAELADFWRANPPSHDRNSPVPSHHWFHYTDVPVLNAAKYAEGKTGRSQWDIVHIIRYCVRVLKGDEPEDNPRKITRTVAVILLAHFVGDIHQPLHVGAQFFDEKGEPVDPDGGAAGLEDQGGNTIVLKHTPAAAERIGQKKAKLHGFWDNQAVAANLPILPKKMPKEERRARTDEARKTLVAEFAREEPKGWRAPADVPPSDYGEVWANEILPIAREAHERLQFRNMAPKQEHGQMVAAGFAEEKAGSDGPAYDQWAARVVREELHKAGWRLADVLEKALR
ncbi:MAG: S1/P1 nuclease [Chthoniobacterales bacterium]